MSVSEGWNARKKNLDLRQKSKRNTIPFSKKYVEQINLIFLHKILLRKKVNLDESINEVKKVFFDTKKIKFEDCKYKRFSTNMKITDFLKFSNRH